MKKSFVYAVLVLSGIISGFGCELSRGVQAPQTWRSGWTSDRRFKEEDEQGIIDVARDLQFNALIFASACHERTQNFAVMAAKEGIDTYWRIMPATPTNHARSAFMQVMPEKDRELLQTLRSDGEWRRVHQHGGEPVPGHRDLFRHPRPCLHRTEVMAATKDAIRETLGKCPAVSGIAFDGFGYQNYHNCVCDESRRQLDAFRQRHPALSAEESERKFALESLVGSINELADFARSIRPDIKTTIHIWPTYLPEPLYGNRLDMDYCEQTVAWFFPPYWPDEKIAQYAGRVVDDANNYFSRPKGIPFVATYIVEIKDVAGKPADRFQKELKIVFENTHDKSFSIPGFDRIAKDREYIRVLREVLGRGPQGETD